MPLYSETWVAPFEAVYIGDYGSNSVLTRIDAVRTEGARFSQRMETEYTPLIDAEEQVGDVVIECQLSFFENDQIKKLVRGVSIAGSPTAALGTQQYSVFLVHPNYTARQSYWLPQVSTVRDKSTEYTKSGASIIRVTFRGTFRSVYKVLELQESVQNCLTSIGSRAPFIYQ